MKRLFTAGLLLASFSMFSQQPMFLNKASQPVLVGTHAKEWSVPFNGDPLVRGHNRGPVTGTVIGHTTYDLQTNSADQQRFVRLPGGQLATTWTGAMDPNVNPPDRGTFYQYFDGATWLTEPTTRIEHVRTGWPSNAFCNGKEVIYAHDFAIFKLVRMSRNTIGSGTWNVETNTGINGSWPRIATNTTSDTIHIIGSNYNGVGNSFLLYWRSPDAGASLDVTARRLPGIDTASGYTIMGADAYAIAARGNHVAIVAAGMMNDLAVWISGDRGDTWNRYRIIDFPIDNFDGNVISDVNGDLLADTIWTNDGGHTIAIDNDNKVHVWTGRMRILDETAGDSSWSYFPGTNGLYYWNEDMGEDSIVLLTGVLDLDGSGDLNGIGADIPLYELSMSGMPTAAVDETTGRIILVYAAMVEFSDYLGDPTDPAAQSFRDLYSMYSDDGGTTWSEPINQTNSALEFKENVYPTAARQADGQVHVQWQRDEEPGIAYLSQPDPPVNNEIVYQAFDPLLPPGGVPRLHQETMHLYPNPVSGPLFLAFEEGTNGPIEVAVFDLLGQEVLSQHGTAGSGSVLEVETGGLTNGLYMIRLTVDDLVISKRFEVQR